MRSRRDREKKSRRNRLRTAGDRERFLPITKGLSRSSAPQAKSRFLSPTDGHPDELEAIAMEKGVDRLAVEGCAKADLPDVPLLRERQVVKREVGQRCAPLPLRSEIENQSSRRLLLLDGSYPMAGIDPVDAGARDRGSAGNHRHQHHGSAQAQTEASVPHGNANHELRPPGWRRQPHLCSSCKKKRRPKPPLY